MRISNAHTHAQDTRRGHDQVPNAGKDRSHLWPGPRGAIPARCPADQQSTRSDRSGGSSYAQAASQGQPSLLLEAQDSPTHDRVRGWEKRRRGRSDREERKPRARAHTRPQEAHARTRLAPIFWRKDMGGRSRPPPDPKSVCSAGMAANEKSPTRACRPHHPHAPIKDKTEGGARSGEARKK